MQLHHTLASLLLGGLLGLGGTVLAGEGMMEKKAMNEGKTMVKEGMMKEEMMKEETMTKEGMMKEEPMAKEDTMKEGTMGKETLSDGKMDKKM